MTHMSDHLRVAKAAKLAEDRQARAAKPKEKTPPPTQSVKRPHRPGQLSAEQMAARLADMQVLGPVSKLLFTTHHWASSLCLRTS